MTIKTQLIKNLFSILCALLIVSCSSNDNEVENNEGNENENTTEETFNYTSSAPYNLNIVYFSPKNMTNRKDSHRRLSEILLQGQDFFKKEMVRQGFGEKTFNMLIDTDKKRVKIDYVEGKQNASFYPYEGGGNKMITEIEEYYKANPNKRNSDHYLVISPVNDPTNNNAPYYGLGKWCFATDYNDMDIKHLGGSGTLAERATIYIGGLLHELGHGLNLPHNKEKVSDVNNVSTGTALMGAGNYTYGSSPTFLTKASCAILNNNQIFNTTNNNYYTGATTSVENLTANYEDGNINISGDISSDVQVNYVSIYNDPADDNADYDAVTWATEVVNNKFTINMPINELHKKGDTPYVLRLRLNHISGDITSISYAYQFKNNQPIIGFGEQNYLDRTNWSITDFSSEEITTETGKALEMIDGDKSTFWHSCWIGACASAAYPHYVTVDTGGTTTVNGFAFTQRQTLSRSIKDIEIHISDDNENWTSLGNFTLANANSTQNFFLDDTTTFRYFKIESKSAHDNDRFAALAEVMCFLNE